MPMRPPVHGAEQAAMMRKQGSKAFDTQRGTAAQRGYDNQWREYRLVFLRANPLCVRCLVQGLTVQATIVDHIKPHKGNRELFRDPTNHQALCKPCHDKKTATEDGGFGKCAN